MLQKGAMQDRMLSLMTSDLSIVTVNPLDFLTTDIFSLRNVRVSFLFHKKQTYMYTRKQHKQTFGATVTQQRLCDSTKIRIHQST